MPLDTNNNFTVTGTTSEAVIATDYSPLEGSHFQIMKVAFGATGDNPTRVTSSTGLPVTLLNSPTVAVSSITTPVSVSGSLGIFGVAGATAIGVTASNLGIRALTAGDPTAATAVGADFVRVVGASGGFPVGITASNLGIRGLTAGSIASGTAHTGADFVRVVGASGAFPVGVTASSLDIRGITFTRDSISVLNSVSVLNAESTPFVSGLTQGFQSRLLRASTGDIPLTSQANLQSYMTGLGSVEDTVRVVGISGATPVASLAMGLTGSNRVPLRVDNAGNLFVNLASGTIGVTANITSTNFTLSGVSLAAPGNSAGAISVHGYAGADAVPVRVSATNLSIRSLDASTDTVNTVVRVLGASGDYVGLTGDAWTSLNNISAAVVKNSPAFNVMKTDDINASGIKSSVDSVNSSVTKIQDNIKTAFDTGTSSIRVNVVSVSQPGGVTSGRVNCSPTAAPLGSFSLNSGVHLKADIANSNTTPIFVGSVAMMTNATNGIPLYNGDMIFIETDNTNKIYFSCATAGLTLYYVGT